MYLDDVLQLGRATCAPLTFRTRVKDLVDELLPRPGALGLGNSHGALEGTATAEELTIEIHIARESVGDPRKSWVFVAHPREEDLSGGVPVGAVVVQLLAHPPAHAVATPLLGQQHFRRCRLDGSLAGAALPSRVPRRCR